MTNSLKRWSLWLLPLIFLVIFFFYPLGTILGISLLPEGTLDLSGFIDIATTPYFWRTLGFTAGQAALSTLITLALAIPGAYVFTRYRFPFRNVFAALAGLPFVLPTVVVAAAYLALIGPRGLLNLWLMQTLSLDTPPIQLERTLSIILIAHVFYNYGVAFRLIAAYWARRSQHIEQAAQMLGAHGWRLWWEVRLPLLRPALLAAGALVFIYTFTSFGVIVILGGPQFATLEVEIYRQITALFNLPTAAALSIVQIAFVFAAIIINARLEKATAISQRDHEHALRIPKSRRSWLMVIINVAFVSLFLAAPLGALIMRSFLTPEGAWTLSYYANLGTNPRGSVLNAAPNEALLNSLTIALAATLFTILVGTLTAWLTTRPKSPQWVDALFMLPLATSAIVLGFGFNLALDEPPLNLRSEWILLPLAHTLVALPFMLRSVSPALRAIPPHLEAAAHMLGASGWRLFWNIHLPLIRRTLIASAVFAFTISIGEFGATLFVARPNAPTLPIAIFRLLGQPGESNYGQALALSTLMLSVCALAFVVIERFQQSNHRD